MVKNLSKHAEWLSLIEISGPFLTVSMLDKAFPQGLEAVETPRRQKLRAAHEEWREAVDQEDRLLPELHREWVRLVLTEMLEYDHESLVHAGDWPDELPSVSSQEHAGTFKPDWIVRSPADGKPRLFIAVLPPDTDLESVQRGDGWPVSLKERMALLCRAHGVRVGLLTDGERWMLVNAPVGSTSSQASWYARFWFQEPITLKAFQSLLGIRRCFGPAEDTLETLLAKSLEHHEEVTDTLGEQVRRAVEVLVQCLDKADEDRNRELLRDVKPAELYEAGLTVMMRLVFVLCAEERNLLPMDCDTYVQNYAIYTMRGQLAEDAALHGPEVLDRRYDAWARFLAVFRAVYGGISYQDMPLPALGGSLFDPDRFPFLEGRAKSTSWRDTSAAPLPIDNRTVLLLLNSLQILEQSGGALLLSYRALDVEQIGHVYEGLLEHTVARVPRVTLGLQGSQKAKNPNVALAELESARLDGEAALVKMVLDVTGRSESAIRNGLAKPADDTIFSRVLGVCGGDTTLAERIRPFTNLIRTDAWDDPIVYRDNSFMVTLGADRRETGTHYTPKTLTESIVTTTLESVVYVGPAEGKPREEWTLKSSREILDLKVCDPAMGSGAFLVQACRYLGEKLVEAWLHEEAAGKAITVDGEALDQLGAEEPLPSQFDERLTIARRLVAERCLYGVDINPLAVELAKLSIWLVTLAKGRPFGFLDHNLRSGDSLLGIHRVEQLTRLRMDTESGQQYQLRIFGQNVEAAVNEAIELRKRLRATTIRDIKDVEAMARLDREARRKLESVELIADAMIGEALRCGGNARALDTALDTLATMAGDFLSSNERMGEQIARQAKASLAIDLPEGKPIRKPFHWALEFPEVFERCGFDGIVGNPPFMGGQKISGNWGSALREFFVVFLGNERRGSADLVAYFFLRAFHLIRQSGSFTFVATKTISEGDTREVGLDQIIDNQGHIYQVTSAYQWPGKAAVLVAIVSISKHQPNKYIIDGNSVDFIDSSLSDGTLMIKERLVLDENKGISCIGSYLQGTGFYIERDKAEKILQESPSHKEVIKQLVRGDDIINSPTYEFPFYGINFSNKTQDQARRFENAYALAEKHVKPEREAGKDKKLAQYWWIYKRPTLALYEQAKKLDRVLVHGFTSKYVAFRFVSSNSIFVAPLVVFLSNEYTFFAILQGSLHKCWVENVSNMGTTLRYTPSDCFETFPRPLIDAEQEKNIHHIGQKHYEYRDSVLTKRGIGLTELYNMFHDSREKSEDIQHLRNIEIELDEIVLTAYGWDDLQLGHGFYETKQGVRFVVSEGARKTILQRLLKLNNQRHEQEENTASCKKVENRKRNSQANNANINDECSLFLEQQPNRAAENILNYLSTSSDWLAKEDIILGCGVPANQWQSTINQLFVGGLVERQGERRGARYRAARKVDLDE